MVWSIYIKHEATLLKLKQSSNVAAFKTEFERVGNRAVGRSQQALHNCFISSVKPEAKAKLQS